MIQIIEGDLIKLAQEGKFDYIIHGCNCFNTMGAGIAKAIKDAFPGAAEIDSQTRAGDIMKLGHSTSFQTESGLTVVNAYTQYKPGPHFEYAAWFTFISSFCHSLSFERKGIKVGLPKIGSGIGGGDWNLISKILEHCYHFDKYDLPNRNVEITVVEFKP